MSSQDYGAILKAFHVKDHWASADDIASRVGYAGDLLTALDDLARERHKCAHEALYTVTTLWLRSLPDRIVSLALTLDVLVSVAAVRLRSGDHAFLSNPQALEASDVSLRFIKDRGGTLAEMVEGGKRARRVSQDGAALFAEAAARCSGSEALVRDALGRGVVAWSVPSLG